MLIPYINRRRSIQCPITGTKFRHNGNPLKRRECLKQQQEFTSNLIIELDGDGDGIRRPILFYHDEYIRRYGLQAASAA